MIFTAFLKKVLVRCNQLLWIWFVEFTEELGNTVGDRWKKLVHCYFCFYTLFRPPISKLSLTVSFIHMTTSFSSCEIFKTTNHMIPPGTFPAASAAALTLFLLAQQADGCAGINVVCPAFPSSYPQVFKSAQVSHQREEGQIIKEISAVWRQGRCLNTMPEFVYFPFYHSACTSRLLLSPTYTRVSNPLWQDLWSRFSWFRHRPTSWQSNQDWVAPLAESYYRGFCIWCSEFLSLLQCQERNLWAVRFQISMFTHTENTCCESTQSALTRETSTDTSLQLFSCDPE